MGYALFSAQDPVCVLRSLASDGLFVQGWIAQEGALSLSPIPIVELPTSELAQSSVEQLLQCLLRYL